MRQEPDILHLRQPEFGEVRIGEQNMEFDYSEWKTIGYSYDSTLHWSELETKDGFSLDNFLIW